MSCNSLLRVATLASGSPSRVAEFDVATGHLVAKFIYVVDPIAAVPVPPTGAADRGIVEMLSAGGRRFVTMERSFSAGVGFSVRRCPTTTSARSSSCSPTR